MNEGYSAPCGSVLGFQDADPRSSKELRKWSGGTTMDDERFFLVTTQAKVLLAAHHVDFTISETSLKGPLEEASALLQDVLAALSARLAELKQK